MTDPRPAGHPHSSADPRTADPSSVEPSSADTAGLERGVLGFTPVLMQGVTHIAPAFGLFFSFQLLASVAGVTAPLAYVVGAVIMLLVATTLGSIARKLPSTGGYFTYVSRGLNPQTGFLISWLYVLYSPITAGLVFGIVGLISDNYFQAQYGFSVPWYWWVLAGLAFTAYVSYRGIQIAAKLLLATGLIEMAALLALSVSGLTEPGAGGFNLDSFNPAQSLSGNGFYLAVVFAISAYTGWESIAPLARETANPRRNVPRAMLLSIVVMAVFWAIVTWGILIGFGTADIGAFATSEQNPMLALASRLWGGASVVLLVALWNSALAVGLALFNVTTRMWFGMAEAGALPRMFTAVHRRYRTPTRTIAITLVINLLVALVMGLALGADQAFFFYAYFLSFALVFIYGVGNLAVYRFFRTQARAEFNPLIHLVFPVVSTAALIWVQYRSTVPLPAAPIRYGVIVFVAWFLAGLGILVVMRARGKQDWIARAGRVIEGVDEAQPTGAGA